MGGGRAPDGTGRRACSPREASGRVDQHEDRRAARRRDNGRQALVNGDGLGSAEGVSDGKERKLFFWGGAAGPHKILLLTEGAWRPTEALPECGFHCL